MLWTLAVPAFSTFVDFLMPPGDRDISATLRKSDINVTPSMGGRMKNPDFSDHETGLAIIKKILVLVQTGHPSAPKVTMS